MKQFLFPAVFIKQDDGYSVVFPDLNIFTEGKTLEEAYLFAKDYLRVYCCYAIRFELEMDRPSTYEKIAEKYTEGVVMMIDAFVSKGDK